MTTLTKTGTETMRVVRDIQNKGVAEWLQSVPEDVLVSMHEEHAAEAAWNTRFAETEDALGALVARAKAEAEQGDVLPFDPANSPKK
ncbi:hypothetical protein [Rhodospirillum sp. A1_3_36]|uniref:hypothetical protein n=1 Tax=Rhodospirillum sp. A1_3_36 TaxID=3391666 RepID=UPI0039A7686F